MSTNYYWIMTGRLTVPTGARVREPDKTDPAIHIGKRSGSGLYCYDCGVPLVEEVVCGVEHCGYIPRSNWCAEAVHGPFVQTLAECPRCGGVKGEACRGPDGRLRGVAGSTSFNWAQEPARVIRLCLASPDADLVCDEYGMTLTGQRFLDLVLLAPLWFTDSVGKAFS